MKNRILSVIETEYVTLAGVAFHLCAVAFIWVSSAYMFKTINSWLIPIAGMIVTLDHIAMVYKLYNNIDWKTEVTREVKTK